MAKARSISVPSSPVKTITWEEIRAMKALDRKRDWDRLARGEITAEDLQRENSCLTQEFMRNAKITNLVQIARAYRRKKQAS